MAWFHTLTFCKKYLCSKKLKYGINYSWTCVFYYINICCKKLKYGIKPNFSKDRIRPPLVNFSAFLKKNTTTGSSHFLSPNGQGAHLVREREWYYVVSCKRGHFSKNEFWFSDLPNPSNKVNRCRRAASTQFAMTYFQYEEYCKIWSKYHRGTWTENNSNKKSLFFMFYQILKGVYTSNLFETCFMVANDDLKVKQLISLVFTPIQFPDQKS